MTPDASGYPLQIYCYTTTAWTAYEAVQSEIFEHIAAIAPTFGLRLFNNPSGLDIKSLAPNASQQQAIAQSSTTADQTAAATAQQTKPQ